MRTKWMRWMVFLACALASTAWALPEGLPAAKAHWNFGAAPAGLQAEGPIQYGVAEEGVGAQPGAKAARLENAYFRLDQAENVAGDQLTVYLRARDPRGAWQYGLLAKRGIHSIVNFNLFSVTFDAQSGPRIGFELHTDQGFVGVNFPVSKIDATAWHDFVGRYDGKRIELYCDGKRMASKAWGGALTQNDEPICIGAETDQGKVVRSFTGDLAEAAIWHAALSEADLAKLMRVPEIGGEPLPQPRYDSPIHFRPRIGRLADTIPFFWKGEYHLFYLRAIDKVPWEHIVSTDLVHWKELPTALVSDGAPESFDGLHMFTGSVTEKDGVFHIYYTGWNPANPQGREFVVHATSSDLITWAKHPEDAFRADEVHYQNTDFRDPFIAWNEKEQQYWMFVCARDAKSGVPVQGVLKSEDMLHWIQSAPLLMEPGFGEGTPECPDVFQIDGLFHLIHSPSAGFTDQRYATEMGGPYRPPFSPHIDTPILYAAKRMFDGKRHILHGWVRDLGGEVDGGDMQWGGDLSVAREVYAGKDGQLLFRPAPEIVAVFKNVIRHEASVALGTPVEVPDNYLLECELKLTEAAEATISFRQQAEAGKGYRLVLRPGKQEATIVGATFDYARPVALDVTKPVHVRAFVMGSIIECFINDAFAFTCRAYDFRKGTLRFSAEGGEVLVGPVVIKTP